MLQQRSKKFANLFVFLNNILIFVLRKSKNQESDSTKSKQEINYGKCFEKRFSMGFMLDVHAGYSVCIVFLRKG